VTTRYPTLKFVSVESGFGYWPYMLDHLDWYWTSSGAAEEFPDAELPSEIWRRQFYATFWFERSSVPMMDAFQDNLMFETDFPHETSLPAANQNPGEYAAATMRGVDPVVARKVLYENAARLYGLDIQQSAVMEGRERNRHEMVSTPASPRCPARRSRGGAARPDRVLQQRQ